LTFPESEAEPSASVIVKANQRGLAAPSEAPIQACVLLRNQAQEELLIVAEVLGRPLQALNRKLYMNIHSNKKTSRTTP